MDMTRLIASGLHQRQCASGKIRHAAREVIWILQILPRVDHEAHVIVSDTDNLIIALVVDRARLRLQIPVPFPGFNYFSTLIEICRVQRRCAVWLLSCGQAPWCAIKIGGNDGLKVRHHGPNICEFGEDPATEPAEIVRYGYPKRIHRILLVLDIFIPVALDLHCRVQWAAAASVTDRSDRIQYLESVAVWHIESHVVVLHTGQDFRMRTARPCLQEVLEFPLSYSKIQYD